MAETELLHNQLLSPAKDNLLGVISGKNSSFNNSNSKSQNHHSGREIPNESGDFIRDLNCNFHQKHVVPCNLGESMIAFQFKQMRMSDYPELSYQIKKYICEQSLDEKPRFKDESSVNNFLEENRNYIVSINQKLELLLIDESQASKDSAEVSVKNQSNAPTSQFRNFSVISDDTSQISNSTRAIQIQKAQIQANSAATRANKILLRLSLRELSPELFSQQFKELNEACFGVFDQQS